MNQQSMADRPVVEHLEQRQFLSAGAPEIRAAIDPADFVSRIDNPYFPLIPGTTFVYRGTEGTDRLRDVFTVTHKTKQIQGVTTTVVRDRAFVNGELVESTIDWFAQDRQGNVWYFGEASREIEDGKVVGTEGSWEAGVDGAKAGIIMKAQPRPGDRYRQEIATGVAEDRAAVLSLSAIVDVPFGAFSGALQTREWSLLERGVVEHKFYARGVGFVRSEMIRGGSEILELVAIRH